MGDLPDLARQRDDVRGVPDELQRARQVQTIHNHREGAAPIDLYQRTGVRERRSTGWPTPEDTLGQGIQPAYAAELDVNK